MNDITKARHFLKARASNLQHLESFSLMLASAENKYREIKLRQGTKREDFPGALSEAEVEAAVEYAVLRYLKKHNQLPKNVGNVLQSDVTSEQKLALAQEWANS